MNDAGAPKRAQIPEAASSVATAFASAQMVPALPSRDVEVTQEFWNALGLPTTYHQQKPNPYVAFGAAGFNLHYYGLPGLLPNQSHSTCIVVVDDPGVVFGFLAEGLRAQFGRLPLTGNPRITRPRARANAEGNTGFSLVDPDGNWIRFSRRPVPRTGESPEDRGDRTPLARALDDAVVSADSRGVPEQALKTLSGAYRRLAESAEVADRVFALAYLAEFAVRLEDPARARDYLASLDELEVAPHSVGLAQTLAEAAELRAALEGPQA